MIAPHETDQVRYLQTQFRLGFTTYFHGLVEILKGRPAATFERVTDRVPPYADFRLCVNSGELDAVSKQIVSLEHRVRREVGLAITTLVMPLDADPDKSRPQQA